MAADPKELALKYVDKVVLVAVVAWLLWSAYGSFFAGGEGGKNPADVITRAAREIMKHLDKNKADKPTVHEGAKELKGRYEQKVPLVAIRSWVFEPPTPKTMPGIEVEIGKTVTVVFPRPLVNVGRPEPFIATAKIDEKNKKKVHVDAKFAEKPGKMQFSAYDADRRRYDQNVKVVDKIVKGQLLAPVDLAAEAQKGLILLSWRTDSDQRADVRVAECRVYRLSATEVARGVERRLVYTAPAEPNQFQPTRRGTFPSVKFQWNDESIEPDETYSYWVSTFAQTESDAIGPVNVRSVSDVEIKVVGGGGSRIRLVVRKFQDGRWHEGGFTVGVGGLIGHKKLGPPDADGRRIFVDWSTRATLIDVVLNAAYVYDAQ